MKNSIVNTHPEIVSEWHPSKNEILNPNNFSKGSHTKIWWQCKIKERHIWYAQIKSRTSGNGCPICGKEKSRLSRLKPKKGESLAEKYPKLAKEWHLEKNGGITPKDINAGTSKKYWWKCNKGNDHIWEANVASRTKGSGCAVCAGIIVVPQNSLAYKNPQLANEWHPTKNGNLTPMDVTLASPKKVWWKCNKGNDHEWQAKISNRSSLSQGCSVCSNRTVVLSNCLATTHPQLAKEWDYKKNSLTPFEVVSGNHNKVYWKCLTDKTHPPYFASIEKRVANRNCPKCGELNRRKNKAKAKKGSSLGDLYPHLVKEWHIKKNGDITPFDVNAKSHKKFWWKCEKGKDHIWQATLASRTNKKLGSDKYNGCSICRGFTVVKSNSLATTHPYLIKEWHPTKNGHLTPYDVFSGSHKKVWWKCLKNPKHPDWKVDVRNRALKDSRCNYCWPTPQSKEELTILFELKWIFNSIDCSGYNLNVEGKKWAVDIYIKKLNLVIEYDGIYWHGKKENLDKIKTNAISTSGYRVLRIRQHPLEKIQQHDISFDGKFKGKKICNDILLYIIGNYDLKNKETEKIKLYLESKNLQNTKQFQKYVSEKLGDKKILK